MVDKSTSLLRAHFGLVFLSFDRLSRSPHPLASHPYLLSSSSSHPRPFPGRHLAPSPLTWSSMGPAEAGNRGRPLLSTVGCFSLRPSPESAVGTVAPDACHLALAAAQASPAAIHEGAQNGSTRATTPDEPRGGETAVRW